MELVYRLGWTLMHSLWQGAIIAAVAAVALRLLSRHTANARYLTACSATGLLLAVCAATFVLGNPDRTQAQGQAANGSHTVALTFSLIKPIRTSAELRASSPGSWPILLSAWIDRKSPLAGEVWLAGTVLLAIWRIGTWISVQRLRVLQIEPPQPSIIEAARRLARVLNIAAFEFRLSRFVQTPMVIGWLRPVILIPTSVVTGLSPGQLEAILAHELAHIRRHDYLVALVQILAETLLFYHPAVWWLSRQISLAREQACDDIAISVVRDRHAYAGSLAALEELRFAGSPILAAGGSDGRQLLVRLRRILCETERSSGWGLRGAWSFVLIALVGGAVCCQPNSAPKTLATTGPVAAATGVDDLFKFDVPIVQGKSEFTPGDQIIITSVKGTSPDMSGGIYCVRGNYTLASHDRARIAAYVTAANAGDATGPVNAAQNVAIEKGSGSFTLLLPVSIKGRPHVSFYAVADRSDHNPAAARSKLNLDQAMTAYVRNQNRLVNLRQTLDHLRESYGTIELEGRSNKMQAGLIDAEKQLEDAKNNVTNAEIVADGKVVNADQPDIVKLQHIVETRSKYLDELKSEAKDLGIQMDEIAGVRGEINAIQQQLVAMQAYIAAVNSNGSKTRTGDDEDSSFGGIYIGAGDVTYQR